MGASPTDTLVTEVNAVQDLLTIEGTTEDERHPITSEEIVQSDGVVDGDPAEPSRDLAEPDPDRVETTRSRIIRNTTLTHDIKQMYDHECQICGTSRWGPDGDPYAEAHHVRPLGSPHDGPDEPGNILILCPNHHADFDYGRLTVDSDTYVVSHLDDETVDGITLTIAEAHSLNDEHLQYHNRVIAGDQ